MIIHPTIMEVLGCLGHFAQVFIADGNLLDNRDIKAPTLAPKSNMNFLLMPEVVYDKIREPATTLIIQTGEQRRFANLIRTFGVVKMVEESNF